MPSCTAFHLLAAVEMRSRASSWSATLAPLPASFSTSGGIACVRTLISRPRRRDSSKESGRWERFSHLPCLVLLAVFEMISSATSVPKPSYLAQTRELYTETSTHLSALLSAPSPSAQHCFADPRAEGMGVRLYYRRGEEEQEASATSGQLGFTEITSDEYNLRRILHAVPEGIDELEPVRPPVGCCVDWGASQISHNPLA